MRKSIPAIFTILILTCMLAYQASATYNQPDADPEGTAIADSQSSNNSAGSDNSIPSADSVGDSGAVSGGQAPETTANATTTNIKRVIEQAGASASSICNEGAEKVIKSEDNDLGIIVGSEEGLLVTKNCIAVCKQAGKKLYSELDDGRKVLNSECKSYCSGNGIEFRPWIKRVICSSGAVSGVKEDIPTESKPVSVCVPDDSLMKRLKEVMAALEEASKSGDTEKASVLKKTMVGIKGDVEKATIECKREYVNATKPVSSSAASGGGVISVDVCTELKRWIEKRDRYASMLTETAAMLDVTLSEEQVRKIVKELEEGISKLEEKCKSASQNQPSSSGDPVKPVAIESGEEISGYYKEKVQILMEKAEGIDQKIATLKDVRKEIDAMIGELIRKKQDLNLSEMEGIVDKIKVTPNKISADNVDVMVTDKKIKIKFKDRELELENEGGKVTLKDGNFNATAEELSVSPDGNLSFKDKDIKTLPRELMAKLKGDAKKIEIKLDNEDRPVYRVTAYEAKNLLGFIPVTVEKEVIVDASSDDATVIEETRPWWAYLAF